MCASGAGVSIGVTSWLNPRIAYPGVGTQAAPSNKIVQEDGSGSIKQEDGSGAIKQE